MSKKIGFIGTGNMGGAIIGGIVASGLASGADLIVFDADPAKAAAVAAKFGVQAAASLAELARASDILFVAVKPYAVATVLEEAAAALKPDCVIVSIAAGVTLTSLESALGGPRKLVRAMPNTPALVNAAMCSLTPNALVSDEDLDAIKAIFMSFGEAEVVPEKLIHAVTGVSGSAPAYVFMFIEAMADAAVLGGMPRDKAYRFAAQAVLGSAKMVLDTGKHPGELKDMVCSPSGTTIEAVQVLEEKGFRAAVIAAITRCMEKSEAMSRG